MHEWQIFRKPLLFSLTFSKDGVFKMKLLFGIHSYKKDLEIVEKLKKTTQ